MKFPINSLRVIALVGILIFIEQAAANANMARGMLDQVEALSPDWQTRAFAIADTLFSIVALTALTITAARYAIKEHTLHGFSNIFAGQLVALVIPWALLKLAHGAIPTIIAGMSGTAQNLAGATTTLPIDIFKLGLKIAASLIGGAIKGSIITMVPGPFQGLAGQLLGVPPDMNQVHGLMDNALNTAASIPELVAISG